ncbi:MAG: hypothetical protein ABIN55_06600 [Aeromicrobium sp.]
MPTILNIAYVVLTAEPLDRDDLVPLPERSLLRLRGSSVKDLNLMAGLPHQRLVSRSVGPGAARLAAEEALHEALDLADRHEGLVLDLQTPRILETPVPDQRPAAGWFTFEYDLDNLGEIRTHGLSVLGLPEIIVRNVPEDERKMYDMVVVGLVHRLLDEWPKHDPVGPAHVTLGDIMAGYEGGEAGPTDRGVDVLVDYDADVPALTVEVMTRPGPALF